MDVRWEKQAAVLDTPAVDLQVYLGNIERAARGCYRSKKTHVGVDRDFIMRLIKNGHESPIEFGYMHAIFRTSRGITHEIVRHRLFSFCQESTRYVNYQKLGYIPIILPDWVGESNIDVFRHACECSANAYETFIVDGHTPQEARDVLLNATATTLHVAGNFREWRHFFKLRTAITAHPEMRLLAMDLLGQVLNVENMDIIFGEFAE